VALALFCVTGVARAQGAPEAGGSTSGPPRVVDLTVAAASDDADAVERVIEELLAGLDVATRARRVPAVDPREVVTPPAEPVPALARVWLQIDLPDAMLYLADAPWERVLVRRVPIGALDEAAREQLAQIVHTAVEALLGGATIGLDRAEARATIAPGEPEVPDVPDTPVLPPPVAAPAPAQVALEAWLGAGVPVWSDGPRAGIALFARGGVVPDTGRVRPVLSVEARGRLPQTADAGRVDIAFWSVTARVDGGVELVLDASTTFRATAGVALDVTVVEPRPQPGSDVSASPTRDDVTALVVASVSFTRVLSGWLVGAAGLSIDVDLVDTRYVVVDGGTETPVLDPWSVRPWPWLALGARL
jgi:hypothetical protein